MKPYYQDASVTIYHGDCREVDAWLEADVLLTDPPYGIAWEKGADKKNNSRPHDGILNDSDTAARDDVLEMWGQKSALVFGSLYAPSPKNLRHVLVWEKPKDAGLFGATVGVRRDVEGVFMVGAWPFALKATRGSVLRSAIANVGGAQGPSGRFGHPHAKPVDLLCDVLSLTAAGLSVADPFMGSGSTLVAAKSLGRRAIGIELEEKYCEIAARRCSQETLDLGAA